MTLKDARELIGISQLELDREAGLPKGTTNDIESGRNQRPGHHAVTLLVRALRRKGLVGADAERIFPVPGDEARAL